MNVWEIKKGRCIHEWNVESIRKPDGEVFVTIFAGPFALARAQEYVGWKNEGEQV